MVKIAHLADIHIKDKRREEYEKIFNQLYLDLTKLTPDIIVVAGDIFDNKSKASANNIEDVIMFFKHLVEIAPTIVITGNHDTNCSVPGSLDLLTPILNDHRILTPPHFYYFRNSGTYEALNINWHVIATDGPKVDPVLSKTNLNICLFHEEINGAKLTPELVAEGYKLNLSDFKHYDAALGGHIHIRQIYHNKIAYCGSLVQQNIGESHIGHGFLMWNITKNNINITEHDIYNDEGFVRVIIDKHGNDKTATPIPTNPIYWDFLHTGDIDVSKIIKGYTTQFKKEPRSVQLYGNQHKQIAKTQDNITLLQSQKAARSAKEHEEIIRKLVPEEHADAVIKLHKEKWTPPDYFVTGGKFRLLQLQFSNIYAYGPDNIIDFTKLENDLSGVVASNHTGKSSLIDAILFALYEDHPRTTAKKDVVRRGTHCGRVTLHFELDGKEGVIDKTIYSRESNNNPKIYNFMYDGKNLTGGTNPETLTAIENVIGKSIDAKASSFQIQGGENKGFMGLTPGGRKEFLASVMSLGSFDETLKDTKKSLTEFNAELKTLGELYRNRPIEDYETELEDINEKLKNFKSKLIEVKAKHEESEILKEKFTKNITTLTTEKSIVQKEITSIEEKIKDVGNITLIDVSPWLKILDLVNDNEKNVNTKQVNINKFTKSLSLSEKEKIVQELSTLDNKLKEVQAILASQQTLYINLPKPKESVEELNNKLKPTTIDGKILEKPKYPMPTQKQVITDDSEKGSKPTTEELQILENTFPLNSEEQLVIDKLKDIDIESIINGTSFSPKTYLEKVEENKIKLSKIATLIEVTNREIGMYTAEMAQLKGVAIASKHVPKIKSYRETKDLIDACNIKTGEVLENTFVFAKGCASCAKNKIKLKELLNGDKIHELKADLLYHCKKGCDVKQELLEKYKNDFEKCQNDLRFFEKEYEKTKPYRTYLENKSIVDKHIKWLKAINIAKRQNYFDNLIRNEWAEYQNSLLLFKHRQETGTKEYVENKLSEWNLVEKIKKEMEELQLKVEKIKQDYETQKNILDQFNKDRNEVISGYLYIVEKNKQLDAIKNWQDILQAKRTIISEKNEKLSESKREHARISSGFTERKTEIEQTTAKIGFLISKKSALETELKNEKIRFTKEQEVKAKQIIYNHYKNVLKPNGGGISDILLMKGKIALQNKINEGLKEIGARFIIIIKDDYSVHISLGKQEIPCTMGSGYQQFALSIASRLAIWRYSDHPRPDAIIIDEGFGVCDDDYLSLIADSLESLAQSPNGPKLLFIVSHIEQLKMRLKKALTITVTEDGSKLSNLTQKELETPVEVEMEQEIQDIEQVCCQDRDDENRIYCKACDRSYTPNHINKHLDTKKHREAMRKMMVLKRAEEK